MSRFLLGQIEAMDLEGEQDYPSDDDRQVRKFVEQIVDEVIGSREGFLGDEIQQIAALVEENRPFWHDQLDERLCRELLLEIPTMASKVMCLSTLSASVIPSKETAIYLREAVRTYIFGLTQSSIAMSRCALESAFKESRWGPKFVLYFNDRVDEITEDLELDESISEMAKSAWKKASAVLHQRPADSETAIEVLVEVRAVLERLYSAVPPE